jgi:hypothetical protein
MHPTHAASGHMQSAVVRPIDEAIKSAPRPKPSIHNAHEFWTEICRQGWRTIGRERRNINGGRLAALPDVSVAK